MQLLNGLFVWFVFKKFWKNENAILWVMTFLFWQKEFIQSVHIDLLSVLIFYVCLSQRRYLVGVLMGAFVKILPLIFLPYLVIKNFKKDDGFIKKFLVFLFVFVLGLGVQVYLLGGIDFLTGVKTFGRQWIWNPGMYSILIKLFPGKYEFMRTITFFLWLICLFTFLFWTLKTQKNREMKWAYGLFAYSSMMFFSPVYNAWYAVWFLIPALIIGSKWGVCYALMGCWSYLFHGLPDFVWVSEFFSHFLIFPTLYFLVKKINQSVELHEDPPSTQNLAQKT